jgi:hypothetical protein
MIHYNVQAEGKRYKKIQLRCKNMIEKGANVLIALGLLVAARGTVCKTEEFEFAWKKRQHEWLGVDHHGSGENVIEWCDRKDRSCSPRVGLNKRVRYILNPFEAAKTETRRLQHVTIWQLINRDQVRKR